MVAGIDSFRDKFRGFEDYYTVIGGAACDILMSEADIDFRLTKDIDMILILEDKKEEFAKKLLGIYQGRQIQMRLEKQ
ncbi:hypothetical protein [Butyrivibrio sp. TB]|uniref:hypothetical protein n=1 Tax=Butyrivibrio sp. TB TaxID=1520809 RepID=UPI0008B5B05B|nr:hypothetical protein [Butyrivibrio sp. TB]SEQ28217.1 hypothetical protein SAMN02910382_02521 [Butyrivibrio sp. TB]